MYTYIILYSILPTYITQNSVQVAFFLIYGSLVVTTSASVQKLFLFFLPDQKLCTPRKRPLPGIVCFHGNDDFLGIVFTMCDNGLNNGDFVPSPVDVNKPLWDQSTYIGRLNYFARVTSPLLLLKSRDEYVRARTLVLQAKYNVSCSSSTRKF